MAPKHPAVRMALVRCLFSLGTLLLSACGSGAGGPSAPPSLPAGVAAMPSNASVSVTWNPVSGATSYNVYMASAPGVTKGNYSTLADGVRYGGVTSPYTQTGLTNGTTYYFVVTAANGAGESLESDKASATPLAGIGTFTPTTGDMTAARYGHTATLLPNGTVLVAGGFNGSVNLATAEVYDPASGTFTATGTMSATRYGHTATLLPNGKVLVAGGSSGSPLASAELYDPSTGTFSATGTMSAARYGHTATLLPNGTVLVAGGSGGSLYPLTAELYDPGAGTFSATGAMSAAHFAHTATLLPNGSVLVAGGFSGSPLDSAELYDSNAGTFSATGNMSTARFAHTATLLPNSMVLVAGGFSGSPLASAELYDPLTGTFSATTGAMSAARYKHTATLLPNGKVLVVGGRATIDKISALASAELYDPATGIFGATGNMRAARVAHTATLLPNDTVLVAGGFNGSAYIAGAELFQ